MASIIIALSTYGSQRVKHPLTGQTISAYKMGYSSAASAVLLALYGSQARDVASKLASYHYIQIDSEVTVRHGYILLKIADDELVKAEAITRTVHRPAVYRWQENAWQEFPNLNHAEYSAIVGRSGPDFNPIGMLIVSASTGEAESAIAGIVVEKSQRSATDTPWHWLRGDTYPHRELLKRWGCRWSKKRKAWYFIGTKLPDAVQQLIDELEATATANEDEHDPCSVEEAVAILGVQVKAERPTHGSVLPPSLTPRLSDMEIKRALVENGHQPEAIEPLETIEPSPDKAADTEENEPKIRIIKPNLELSDGEEPDAIITAVRQTKTELLPVHHSPQQSSNGRRNLWAIQQSACGELTGSITGSVWCYGYAIYDGICIYVNMGGPRMAVEAIRAKLAKGDIVSCVPWDAPSIELTAGEGNTGMYSAFMQNIPEAKFTSLILCHELLTQPNYGGASTTFMIHVSDEQAMAQLRHHVTKLVKVPVFADWTGYLWQAGQSAMLVRPTRTGGDIKLWTLTLDDSAWTRLITGGLAQGVIHIPYQNTRKMGLI